MTTPDLSVFFRPKGIAVIGASREPGKLGHDTIRNLVQHHYKGAIYPINPYADEILGYPVYAAIQDIPDPVDLAIILLPARYVAEKLAECGQRGIQHVIVVSGGFREVGTEGAALEEQVKQIAEEYHIALLGPNCIGAIDTHTPLNTTFVTGHPVPGEIALVSQSGAVAAAVIDWAQGSGVGFSRIVSLGNQTIITLTDMLTPIVQDNHTKVIITYIEGVPDGQQFLKAAAQAAQEMPVIALKVGRSAGGAKAAASHTGALAGAEAAYDAAFRRAGILRASTFEEMLDWARALAWQPLPKGNRVGVLTNAGGMGIMAVDALEAAGMELAPLTETTRTFLRQRVPPAASVSNPVDILAGSGPATYALCLDALLADETVDAVVVMSAPQDWFEPVSLAEVAGEVANTPLGRRKPVMAVIMGLATAGNDNATQKLHRRHTPNFAFPERVGNTLAAMWQRRQWLDSLVNQAPVSPIEPIGTSSVQALMDTALTQIQADSGWMIPDYAEALLQAYGIRTPGNQLTTTVDQALDFAEAIGYPVVLKLAIKGISHKTDIGGVRLNIGSSDELRKVYAEMQEQVRSHLTDSAVLEGITVQQMIQGATEVIVGAVRDAQFGPLVMAGSGGTQVELMGDVTFELAPVNPQQAAAMLDRTTVGRLLAGYRGKPPADKNAVIDTIQRLAQIALDWSAIAEIEINPLLVLADGAGAYAVDVRIRLENTDQV